MAADDVVPDPRALICAWVAAQHDYEGAQEREKWAAAERQRFYVALEAARQALIPIATDQEQHYLLPPTNDNERGVVSLRAYTGSVYVSLEYAKVL